MIVEVADAQAMEKLGALLASASKPGFVIFLSGELGAGKTTLARGFLRALGHAGAVKSPTYTLVEPYVLNSESIYHFDLYRLSGPEELEFIGFRDYFTEQATCLVEWPERASDRLPRPDVRLVIVLRELVRRVQITAMSLNGAQAIARLSADES